jgi:hypothetical protein
LSDLTSTACSAGNNKEGVTAEEDMESLERAWPVTVAWSDGKPGLMLLKDVDKDKGVVLQ